MTPGSIDWPALLLDYRKSSGLKQAAAAQDFGVSQATISRWERGVAQPTLAVQRMLFQALRRERTPVDAVGWAGMFKRMPVPGLVTSPDGVLEVVTEGLARGLGVPAWELEGLPYEDVFEGGCLETRARLAEEGFCSGRVLSYEAVHFARLSRQVRRGVSFWAHYVGWPHLVGGGRVANVGQGVLVSRQEAAAARSRLGGSIRLTRVP